MFQGTLMHRPRAWETWEVSIWVKRIFQLLWNSLGSNWIWQRRLVSNIMSSNYYYSSFSHQSLVPIPNLFYMYSTSIMALLQVTYRVSVRLFTVLLKYIVSKAAPPFPYPIQRKLCLYLGPRSDYSPRTYLLWLLYTQLQVSNFSMTNGARHNLNPFRTITCCNRSVH